MYGRVVASTTELRGFIREAVGDVYRYALALTVSTTRAEQLTTAAAVRLARHVDAVGAAPVSATRLTLVVRREVLDTLPPRRRRRRTLPPTPAPDDFARSTSSLDALASLSIEQRLALVLRHHDGLLLPDIAAALGVTYPEAEQILHSARDRLAGVVDRYDDGGGADPFGRLVRSVPGPPDALADRVWVTVDEALVPDYAEDGSVWTNGKAGRVPDLSDGDDPLGWEGFNAVPVDERHVPPAREARHVGTTLLIGAGALGVLLAVAALTAPRDDQADTTAGGIGATTPSDAPLTNPTTVATSVAGTAPARIGRGATPPAEPDLVIDAELVSPHSPTEVQALNDPTVTRPDPTRLAEVSVRVRNRDDVSQLVVRRHNDDGTSDVWLLSVEGQVRDSQVDAPELLQAWGIDQGSVIVSLRVAGDPDARVLAGLRAGGGGTWLRLPDGAEPLVARPDGSVLCTEPGENGPQLTTYRVLG